MPNLHDALNNQHDPKLPTTHAPWWMDGQTLPEQPKEPAFLVRGIHQFWQLIKSFLIWPLSQQNPLTCNIHILELLAWERCVPRLADEPEQLYRMRVKYAWINYKDSGSGIGFKQIFERLGLGKVTIKERLPHIDWDIITIELTDNSISENPALIAAVIRLYGRTCRRYRFEVTYPATISIRAGLIDQSHHVYIAKMDSL